MSAARVLVVEDEAEIRRYVKLALEGEGLEVFEAGNLKTAAVEAGTRQPDLVVLDLGLPDGDGVDFIRDLRGWTDAPVIILSARTAETEKVNALDAGADDYLTKPFGRAELLARVRAQLRRRSGEAGAKSQEIAFGDVNIDLERRIVLRAGEPVHLTPIEFKLLTHLVHHPNRVLTHRQLLRNVWGGTHVEHSHYLRVFMTNLRRKLEADPSRPQHFVTEIGIGYRFVP
ncbi:MAG TPA: two-component system response regulator KdpE [Burkholderiaceae bacterium]